MRDRMWLLCHYQSIAICSYRVVWVWAYDVNIAVNVNDFLVMALDTVVPICKFTPPFSTSPLLPLSRFMLLATVFAQHSPSATPYPAFAQVVILFVNSAYGVILPRLLSELTLCRHFFLSKFFVCVANAGAFRCRTAPLPLGQTSLL